MALDLRSLAWLSAVTLAGCQDEQPITGSNAPVASVEVTPDSAAAASLGQTVHFTATARDADGAEIPGSSFTWTSSATSVARVAGSGSATTVGNGKATIAATAGGVTGIARLTVAQQPDSLVLVGGNAQTGFARVALGHPLRVRVTDAGLHPIAGVPVTWQVLSGGGSITGTGTDGAGEATAIWTLGGQPGPVAARASVGPHTAEFTGIALPNGVIQGTISRSSAYLVAARQASAPAGTSSSGAAQPSASFAAPRARRVADELLVRVRTSALSLPAAGSAAYRSAPVAAAAASSLRAAAARWALVEPLEVLGASPAIATLRIRVPAGQAEAVRQRLARLAEVEEVEPNEVAWITDEGTAYAPAAALGEPYFTRQAWHYDITNTVRAWNVTTGNAGVIVAVVDDGIRFDHPDIAANLRSDGYDFVTMQTIAACTSGSFTTSMDGDGPDPNPTIPAALSYNDNAGCVSGLRATGAHGLHVAGTIGARAANGEGGVGIAWAIGIRPIRALGSHGSGTHYDIAQGILYAAGLPADGGSAGPVQAASAARIINLSLAGTSGSSTLHNAVIAATNAGSLLIAASGNESVSAPYYPAAYPEVLSVSAVAPDLQRAPYSNWGSSVDIAAPGGQLALGSDYGVWSLRWSFQTSSPAYDALQGTSMATPHVSGIAALVLAASPGLTQAQLRARLVDHAMDIGPSGSDDEFGAGLVDAEASVRNGPAPRETYVRVYDARSRRVVRSVRTSASGDYTLDQLPDGAYHVYAGQDEGGDGVTGIFDRRWGALGGSTSPDSVSITGSSIESASFVIGYPQEDEPNGSLGSADLLPVGGYAYGTITSNADADLYSFTLTGSTTILIETDALVGSCGYTDQVDTVLRVLDAAGSPLATHDDIDSGLARLCSRIQTMLPAGTYYAEVSGFGSDQGHYGVRIAEVP